MRAILSLFTAVWSLSLVLCDPLNCTEVIDKAKKGDLGIAVDEVPFEVEDAECWKQVMQILLWKYSDDEDRIKQLQLKPVITPAQKEVKYNEIVSLKCAMTVNPNSTLGPMKWVGYKLVDQSLTSLSNETDGVIIPLSNETDEVIISVSEETGRDEPLTNELHLKVTEEWIGALIRCGVEYRDPAEYFDSVTRWSSPHRLNVSLTIVKGPEDVDVRTDKDPGKTTMSCKFAGSNIPMDSPWRRDGVAVEENGKYEVTRVPPDGTEGVVTWTLHFKDVSKTSNLFGNYSCGFKDVRFRNASLIRVEPAKLVHYELGNIVSGVDSVETVVLTCVATGVPPPDITWHCFQNKIKSGVETSITAINYTSKLTLEHGEDVGECSCTVKNKYSGTIHHTFAVPDHKSTATEETNTTGSIDITTVVGPPGIAAVVIILLGGVCIAKKRHKLIECLKGERVTRVVKRTAQLRRGRKPRSMSTWTKLVE